MSDAHDNAATCAELLAILDAAEDQLRVLAASQLPYPALVRIHRNSLALATQLLGHLPSDALSPPGPSGGVALPVLAVAAALPVAVRPAPSVPDPAPAELDPFEEQDPPTEETEPTPEADPYADDEAPTLVSDTPPDAPNVAEEEPDLLQLDDDALVQLISDDELVAGSTSEALISFGSSESDATSDELIQFDSPSTQDSTAETDGLVQLSGDEEGSLVNFGGDDGDSLVSFGGDEGDALISFGDDDGPSFVSFGDEQDDSTQDDGLADFNEPDSFSSLVSFTDTPEGEAGDSLISFGDGAAPLVNFTDIEDEDEDEDEDSDEVTRPIDVFSEGPPGKLDPEDLPSLSSVPSYGDDKTLELIGDAEQAEMEAALADMVTPREPEPRSAPAASPFGSLLDPEAVPPVKLDGPGFESDDGDATEPPAPAGDRPSLRRFRSQGGPKPVAVAPPPPPLEADVSEQPTARPAGPRAFSPASKPPPRPTPTPSRTARIAGGALPTIRDGTGPKRPAAAIRIGAGGSTKVLGQELEEEPLEMGAAESPDGEDDDFEGGFGLHVEEYEEEYEEEEEEEVAEIDDFEPINTAELEALDPEPVGPTEAEIQDMLRRAQEQIETGDMMAGVMLFSDVLDADPDSLEAHIGRGRVYLDMGDYARAMSDFTVAEELAPGSPEPQVAVGDLYFARKDYRKAIDFFNEALNMKPDHAMAYCRRGISHYYRKNYREALADLQKAQKLDDGIPNIQTYVAMAKKKAPRR